MINAEILQKLESISKINLTSEEKEKALEFFNDSIAKFDILANVDTDGIEPLVTSFTVCSLMRDDTAYKMVSSDALFENAPEARDGYFVVPRVLE